MWTSTRLFGSQFEKRQISAPIGPAVSGGKLNLRSDLKDDGVWSSCNSSKCQFWLEYFCVGIENCGSGFKAQNPVDDVLRRKTGLQKKWTNALLSILVEVFLAMFCLGHCLPCRNKLLQSVFLPFGKSKGTVLNGKSKNSKTKLFFFLYQTFHYNRAVSLICWNSSCCSVNPMSKMKWPGDSSAQGFAVGFQKTLLLKYVDNKLSWMTN